MEGLPLRSVARVPSTLPAQAPRRPWELYSNRQRAHMRCRTSLVPRLTRSTVAHSGQVGRLQSSHSQKVRRPQRLPPEPLTGYVWLDTQGKRLHVWAEHLEFREESP
jgi:hypothetical protein